MVTSADQGEEVRWDCRVQVEEVRRSSGSAIGQGQGLMPLVRKCVKGPKLCTAGLVRWV